MIFGIRTAQERDTRAIQLKLDKLIRATQGAKTSLITLEKLEHEDLDKIRDGEATRDDARKMVDGEKNGQAT